MKNLILILILTLIGNIVYSQSEKTLVKTFVSENDKVFINIVGDKKINYWELNDIKILFTVKINSNIVLLNSLVKAGRYDLGSKVDNGVTIINFNKNFNQLIINGDKIIERISLEIWLPTGTSVIAESDFK